MENRKKPDEKLKLIYLNREAELPINPNDGYNLLKVAAQEIGEVLGLYHLDNFKVDGEDDGEVDFFYLLKIFLYYIFN